MKSLNKIRIILYASFLLVIISIQAKAVVRYVSPTGAGLQNGSTWANAIAGTSLQIAINSSASGDEVWVAAGTYFTTVALNRNISFSMRNGVTIYGSFTGTETSISQRVLYCGPSSILSGEIGVAGILDNSYHVISNVNLNNSAVIDGFVITGGNDNRSATFTNGLGGGIYNNGGNAGGICSPVIRNCLITNNQAVFGGGIFNSGHTNGNSNPIISNCIITNNIALDGGGGIDNFGLGGNASPAITNCIIYNNMANTAGGMYCWGGNVNGNSNPVILNCAFINNFAIAGNAGGIIADNLNSGGGGSSGTSNPIVRNSILWGNTASGNGPQFYINGTATFTATSSDIDLINQNPPHIISGAGTGNININPLFTSVTNAIGIDNCWMTYDDGLQLQPGSLCINAGDNTGVPLLDILFNERISNSIVDMGPYEFLISLTLNLKICIEGFYNEDNNTLNKRDSVKVYLRNINLPYNKIDSSISVIDSVSLISVLKFYNLTTGNYYLAIHHRNSIETWSKSGGENLMKGSIVNYDLSNSSSQAYGNNMIQVDSTPVKFAIYSGDVNQDGSVDVTDIVNIFNDVSNFVSGYVSTDLNGDNFVDVADLVIAYNNSINFVGTVRP